MEVRIISFIIYLGRIKWEVVKDSPDKVRIYWPSLSLFNYLSEAVNENIPTKYALYFSDNKEDYDNMLSVCYLSYILPMNITIDDSLTQVLHIKPGSIIYINIAAEILETGEILAYMPLIIDRTSFMPSGFFSGKTFVIGKIF